MYDRGGVGDANGSCIDVLVWHLLELVYHIDVALITLLALARKY
jgi:hypothetical protein